MSGKFPSFSELFRNRKTVFETKVFKEVIFGNIILLKNVTEKSTFGDFKLKYNLDSVRN